MFKLVFTIAFRRQTLVRKFDYHVVDKICRVADTPRTMVVKDELKCGDCEVGMHNVARDTSPVFVACSDTTQTKNTCFYESFAIFQFGSLRKFRFLTSLHHAYRNLLTRQSAYKFGTLSAVETLIGR